MADKPAEKQEAAAPAAAAEQVSAVEPAAAGQSTNVTAEEKTEDKVIEQGANTPEDAKESDIVEKTAEIALAKPEEAAAAKDDVTKADIEMKDPTNDVALVAEAAPAAPANTTTPAPKGKGGRRKSGAGDAKGRGLHKKASKVRLTHIDAQPGDHFLVKLKGFPAWPAIVCDESMLPAALINTRPASAAKEDGSYSEAYTTGGKRVQDRTFPVMYLYTNEFGWVQNTALTELTAEKAKETITDKMRKDVRAAFELAADNHPVDYYKDILKHFQEEQIAQEQARRDAAATPRKSKKGKAVAAMDDMDLDLDEAEAAPRSSKSKKRKAEEETATPQRSNSVKKPKIKLNTSSTPKTANGVATPKSAAGSAAKSGKAKAKKTTREGGEKKAEAPKEAKMTPEERHARKEKEVLYLRHKLQRGLLTREQQPREDEMNTMSEFITVLENFVDLEVSIIRATKINKVLKAILKLESIPREDEFHFKRRSQVLLDKWNKLLATESTPASAAARTTTNGAADAPVDKGVGEKEEEEKKSEDEAGKETKMEANGVQKEAGAAPTVEAEKAYNSKPDGQASDDDAPEEPVSVETQQQKTVDKQAAVAVEPTTAAD